MMKPFICHGFDHSLRPVCHHVWAPDQREAVAMLQRLHLTVTDVRLDWKRLLQMDVTAAKVSPGQLGLFCRQLSAMLSAGLPLVRSLHLLSGLLQSPSLRRLVLEVARSTEEGKSLSESLEQHGSALPPILVRMVAAAEHAGRLPAALALLAEQFEQEDTVRRKLTSASVYPATVAVLALAAQFFFLSYVLPRFAHIYAEMGAALPPSTRTVMALSGALQSRGWEILLATAAAVTLLTLLVRRVERLRGWRAVASLKLPLLGPLNRKRQAARFVRSFGGLYASGVPIIQALELSGGSLTNPRLAAVVSDAARRIALGGDLTSAFRESGLFPPVMTELMAVGEETGQLDELLLRAAVQAETEVRETLDALTKLLEPVLILLLTAAVAAVLIPTLLPVLTISSQLGTAY